MFVFPSTHIVNCVDFASVIHVHGGERLASKVNYPSTELVVTRRDEASLIEVKGVVYVKFRSKNTTMVR